jgi:hypothetical protein
LLLVAREEAHPFDGLQAAHAVVEDEMGKFVGQVAVHAPFSVEGIGYHNDFAIGESKCCS